MCKLSHTRTCLFATCHLISHVLSPLPCFHTNLSTTTHLPARIRTLKTCICTLPDLRYIQHLTPFLSPNFPLMYLKRCTHGFNLQLLLTMQLLTYKTSSRVNFHIGGHVCMSISVCHLIYYVLSQLSCFHTFKLGMIKILNYHIHPSTGERSWRCWVLDHAGRCSVRSRLSGQSRRTHDGRT